MKRILIAAAAIAALGITACDRNEDRVDAAPESTTTPQTAVLPPTAGPEGVDFAYADDDTPEGFVQRMAMNDQYEIEAARAALERTQSPEVRAFAQTMIDAHTATTNEAKAAVQAQGLTVTLPAGLDRKYQPMVNALGGASGDDFDQRYLDQQIRAHQEALDELEDYAEGGTNAAFKAWAAKTAPKVRQHLDRARSLDRGGADGSTTPGAGAATPDPQR